MALDAIEQLLVANHGFTVTPEGAVVSPSGQVRNVVNGKTTFTPYTPPTTEPTFAEQFATQQAQAIADTNQVRQDEAIASGSDTYQSVATDGSGSVTDVSVGTPAAIQPLPPADFMPGLPPAPEQTTDQLKAAIDEARDLDLDPSTRFKNRTSDLTGIKYTDKTAYEYDLGEEYDNVVAVRSGKNVFFVKDGERVDIDRLGLDGLGGETGNEKIQSLFGQLRDQEVQDVYGEFGGEDSALVSEYLADEAAAAQRRADNDPDAFYGKNADSTGRITSGANTGEYSQAFYDQQKRLSDPTRTGNLLTDLQTGLSDIGNRASNLFGFGEERYDDADAFNEGQDSVVNYADIVGDTSYSYKNTDKDGSGVEFIDEYAPNYDGNFLGMSSNYDNRYTGEIPLSELGAYTGDVATYGGGMGEGQSQMYDGMSGTYDLYDEPLEGGLNIPGTNLTITAGGIGPGAGSNTGGGGGEPGGDGDDDAGGGTGGGIGVGVPVIGPGVIGGGTGGGDTGGGGIGGGVPVAGTMPDPSTYIVPSTANYGTDPRFANLAPTYNVSKAAMPIFNRNDPAPSIPIVPVEEEETSLLAQGGIVSLQDGGDPSLIQEMQNILPDFIKKTKGASFILDALDNLDELLEKGFITVGEYNFYKEKQQESVDNSFPYPEAFFASPEGDSELNNLPLEGRGFSVSPEVSPEQESMDEFQKLFRRKQSLERDPTGMVQLMAGGGSPANAFYIQVADTQLAKDNPDTGALYVIQQADIENPFLSDDTRYQIGMVLMGKGHSGRGYRHGGVAERGYSHDGVGSLSDTARNMFRPMVS